MRYYKVTQRLSAWMLAICLVVSSVMFHPQLLASAATTIPIVIEENSFNSTLVSNNVNGSSLILTTDNAGLDGNYLMLTPKAEGQKGTAVRRNRMLLSDTGFSTYFQMYITSNGSNTGDGLCFIVYRADTDTTQSGTTGEGLGYQGINNSIGVEFDTYYNSTRGDPTSPHVAIDTDGSVNHSNRTSTTATANNTPTNDSTSNIAHTYGSMLDRTIHVWVDFDGATGYITVTYGTSSTRSSSSNYAFKRNVGTTLVGKDVYVGFSASTGGAMEKNNIIKWYFSNNYVSGGLSSGSNAYLQGASTCGIAFDGSGTNSKTDPTQAAISLKDASGNAMANQSFKIAIDGVDTGTTYSTGSGGIYYYTLSALSATSHTLKVTSTDGGVVKAESFSITAPSLTAGTVTRTSNTAGTVKFTSSKGGTYYYAVVEDGTSAPAIDTSGTGAVCVTGENTIVNPAGLTAGAKDIYIQAKDPWGNLSGALKMDIPTYVPPVQNSSISPTDATFDKRDSMQADIAVNIDFKGNTLASVKNDSALLTSGIDYTLSDNKVVISKTYLAAQPEGTASLTFNFSAGAAQTLSVTVVDTTPIPVTVTGITALDKPYDGTTTATLDCSQAALSGVRSGHDVQLVTSGASGTFADANAGTNKDVSVAGLSLTGADASKYVLSSYNPKADILPKAITVTMSNKSRDYGTANPAFDFTITSGALGSGDTNTDLAITGATSATQASDVGTYDITGTSTSSNYAVTINKGMLTIHKKASEQTDFIYDLTAKTYNGNTQDISVSSKTGTATITIKYNGLITVPTEPGTYAVTIDVSNATNYQDITDLSLGNYIINKADVAGLALTSSKNPSIYEDEVTFTAATVAVTGGKVPTGTIVFKSGATTLATVALTDGVAILEKSDLPALGNVITAEYSGDSRYNIKTSEPVTQAVSKRSVNFTIEDIAHFYESATARAIKIAGTNTLLTENDFTVKYYLVDENEGLLAGTTPVKNAITAGKYLYVIDFKTAQENYTIKNKFSVSTTDLPNIASYDNVGYMDIKAAQNGQQKPISYANGAVSVYVTENTYKNTLTNENASTVTYHSSNDAIAEVAADGTVKINKAGTVTITAISEMTGTTPVYASYILTIRKKPVTITAQNDVCVFGSAWDKSVGVTYSDHLTAEDFTGSIDFETEYTIGAKVGKYTIAPTGFTSDQYEITFVPAILAVTPKTLSASDFKVSASSKTYDGTIAATVTASIVSGLYSGNSVKPEIEGSFAGADASESAVVNYTITGLTGKDADNYTLVGGNIVGSTTAKISPATVSVICAANTTRTFDGNPQTVDVTAMANGNMFDLSDYTVQYNGNDSAVDVGIYPISIVLNDSVKGNYMVHPFIAVLTINAAIQDVFSIENVPNAVYYGDTFTVSAEGGQDGSVFYSVAGNATINSSTGEVAVTGTGKITVTATKAITGYATRTATRSFAAMPKMITPISNISDSMTYDGTTDVDVRISFADGEIVGNDEVGTIAVATRIDANAGSDKLVYVKDITLTGANKGNYVLADTTLHDSISVTPIEVHAFTIVPDNKVYDGTTKAQARVTAIDGVLSNDFKDVTVAGNAVFDQADTTATKVTYTIESVTGLKSGNYRFVQTTAEAAASISKAKIDFSAGASTFIYDGKPKDVEITGANQNSRFTDFTVRYDNTTVAPSNVGVYSVSILLNDPQNYQTDFQSFDMEIISADQDQLIISGMPGTLEYSKEFTLTATGGSNTSGVISWTSSDTTIATVDSNTGIVKIVGVGKEVAITAKKSGGANFNDETATVMFTPVPKQVSFKITSLNSVYDANTKPVTVTPSDTNMTANVDYTVTYYDEKNQRIDRAPTNAGTYYAEVITIGDKYSGSANATVTVKKATISGVTVVQNDGVYKTALADAAISGTIPAGVAGKITYIGSGIASPQEDKPTDAGEYIVIATLMGENYETYTATNTFTIAPKMLTASDFMVTANDKIYDESLNATLTATPLNITDDVKADIIGGFTSANAGNSVNVSYTITGLTGKDADNYALTDGNIAGSTTAKIYPATVSVICATNTTRTFDGNPQSVDISAMANGAVFDSSNYSVKYNGADSATNVGIYDITLVLDSANYVVKPFSATLTIKEAAQEVFSIDNVPDRVYYGDAFKVSAQDAGGNVTYEVNDGAPAMIDSSGNVIATGVGSVKITATSTKEGYTPKTATKTFEVYPRVVTPTATATNRVYNAESGVDVTVALENAMASDMITASATGIMANADAGENKMVYVSGIALDGTNKDFYTLSTTALQTTVTIEKADITGFSIVAQDKKYDGTTTANTAITDIAGVCVADLGQVGIAGDAVFEDETAGVGKRVTYIATDLTGAKAANYQFASEAAKSSTTTANISPMNIEFIVGTASFQYDGDVKEVITSGADELGRVFTDYTVEYWKDGERLSASPNEAGEYTVRIALNDSVNYTTAQTDVPMTIAQANQEQMTIVGLPSTIEYSDEFTLEAIGGSGSGEVEWESDNSNITVDSNGVVTIGGAIGEKVTITATKRDDINFTEKSAEIVFMPTAKTTSFVLDDLAQVYTGDGKAVAVTPDINGATYDVTYNGSAALPTDAGTYNVMVKATGNYKGTANATLTIGKAKMSGLFISQNGCTYGEALADAVYDSAPNGVEVRVAYSTFDGQKPVKAGEYLVTATYTGSNYETFVVSSSFKIEKKVLTVRANDQTRKYGEANPVFTLSFDGFVNDEDASVLLSEPVATTVATAASPVNDYEIIVSGGRSDNYSFYYDNSGKLKITGAAGGNFYITGANNSVTVGDIFTLHAYYDNVKPAVAWQSSDESVAKIDENGTVTVLKKGDATITAVVTDANYQTGISAEFNLNASKKTIELKPADLVKVYNAKRQDITLVSDDAGFIPTLSGENKNIDITYTLTTDSSVTEPKQAGVYTVTYSINHPSYTGGETVTMYINKATIIVRAKEVTKVYGEENPAYSITGLIGADETNADYISKITGIFDLTSDADSTGAKTKAGDYPITLAVKDGKTLGDDGNYNLVIAGEKGKLTVTKAPLTVKVSDASREYGTDNADPAYQYVGFVNHETENDLITNPVFTYDEGISNESNVGNYSDVITASGATSDNYEISYGYTDGMGANLTINQLVATASAGEASGSYLTVNFSKPTAGLKKDSFVVTSGGALVEITSVSANRTNTAYTLNGSFKTGREYAVTVAASNNYELAGLPLSITMQSSGGGSGGGSSINSYTITVIQADGGRISPDTVSVNENGSKTFTITPNDGYEIEDVLVNGKSVGKVAEYTFEKVTATASITAKFKKVEEKPGESTEPATPEKWGNPFTDVNETDWFYDAVRYVNENGLMEGTGEATFAPDVEVTRAMFVTVLYRAEKQPDAGVSSFTDIENGSYYENAIAWAAANGIVKGISEIEFAPSGTITREQMAAIIQRYAIFKGLDPAGSKTTSYADSADISDYAEEGVAFCTEHGIMSGNGGNVFSPQEYATRAEVAVVLERVLKILQ